MDRWWSASSYVTERRYPEHWDLLGRVNSLPHETVIDLCAGLNHSPISLQVREIEAETLVTVEAWPDYVREHYAHSQEWFPRVKEHLIAGRDALEYVGTIADEKWDLALIIDGLEHFERPDGEKLIEKLKTIVEAILIFLPLGYCPIDHDTYGGNNHSLHTHRATWEESDLIGLGFSVERYEKIAVHPTGINDGAWACWRKEEVS